MKDTIKQPIIGIGITILTIILLSGCASSIATKTSNLPSNTKLLIMPPHDVVQGGLPHAVGKGSGELLQKSIQRELTIVSDYDIVVFEPNDIFNHTTIINKEDAIIEAKKLGVDYCLLLSFGEFLNAAPMTFRPDFVTLDSGVLIDVNTKHVIWSLNQPVRRQKTNIGNHYGLIDNIGKEVAKSIVN